MGLLDAFKQYISDIGGSLNPEIGGLLAQTGETIKRNARQRDTVMKGLLADPSNRDLQRQAVAQGLDMASIAPIGMTVWHGSPHKFTKFDMSKIGTGEGAQAYGHGLYVAESPEVAQNYADFVKRITPLDLKDAKSRLLKMETDNWKRYKPSDIETQRRIVADYEKRLADKSVYKVDIPDEAVARMLDWDKPLSQQKSALKLFRDMHELNGGQAYDFDGRTVMLDVGSSDSLKGKDFYQWLNSNASGKEIAPSVLKQNGIPGIRYLDGGSRGTGTGTSNFVLFDDQMPRILEINGQATGTAPWKPGEWRGLLSP